MTQCRHCLTKTEPRNGNCPVCGIAANKKRSELSAAEKKVRLHARAIRLLALLHLIGSIMGIFIMPELPAQGAVAVGVVLNAALAYGLIRYSLAAYRAAVVFYFLIGIVNVISIQRGAGHLFGIGLALLALYIVGNGTAKAMFERRLPETG